MTIQVRSSGGQGSSLQENNQQNYAFDTHISGDTGKHRVYIHIFSTETPNVRIYLYGLVTNMAIRRHIHSYGVGSGDKYTNIPLGPNAETIDLCRDGTDVPKEVTIWIDGVEKTATIGDANSKGATMYDSTNNDWGIDGTTEWNTGELNLTALITWSVGEHYVEFRCGGSGGRLVGNIYIN